MTTTSFCPRTFLSENHERVVRNLERSARNALPQHEQEDFVGWALLRLVERDYSILRKWQTRSSIWTYLYSVCNHLASDYRIHLFGKWRSSKAAKELGETAELIERCVFREGLTEQESATRVKQEFGKPLSDEQVGRIANHPACALPNPGSLEMMPQASCVRPAVWSAISLGERRGLWVRLLRELVHDASRALERAERDLLRRRYLEGESVAEMSRQRGVEARKLYQQCIRALRTLPPRVGSKRSGWRRARTPGG